MNRPAANYRVINIIGEEQDQVEYDFEENSDGEDNIDIEISDAEEENALYEFDFPRDQNESEDTLSSMVGADKREWTTNEPEAGSSGVGHFKGPNGPSAEAIAADGPKNIFKLMMNDSTIEEIRHWTNMFGREDFEDYNRKREPGKDEKLWVDVSSAELEAFMGLLLLGGIELGRRQPIHELWSSDPAISCPAFVAAMSKNGFSVIASHLRFDDVRARREAKKAEAKKMNETLQKQKKTGNKKRGKVSPKKPASTLDRAEPIKKIFKDIVERFRKIFDPAANMTVDEQLIKFRGKFPFRVYMPKKPGRYGIKIWALVDCLTRFILHLQVYKGQEGGSPEKEQGKRIVMDLVKQYFNTGRAVTADNFFSSVGLALELLRHKLTYVGTLRKSRREVPRSFRNMKGEEHSSIALFLKNHNVSLVRYVPKRNRSVLLISTQHLKPCIPEEGNPAKKPEVILHYNATKGAVDTADQMIGKYTCQRPSRRWSMKIFYHLLDTCALNALKVQQSKYPNITRRAFLRQLAKELYEPLIMERPLVGLHHREKNAMKLFGRQIGLPAATLRTENEDLMYGLCYLCLNEDKKRKTSRTTCTKCLKFVCADPSHSSKHIRCHYCKMDEVSSPSDTSE